jgi:hypothetical protein
MLNILEDKTSQTVNASGAGLRNLPLRDRSQLQLADVPFCASDQNFDARNSSQMVQHSHRAAYDNS